ncbi:DUF418 domain-containing protein [Saccharopolyspora sp. 5N708]|uniref:DUF418 domain-containing protein n=1 Tax=Saccharopolyspora sp. 5N708 TaxID=3457424 RepID=UPI003FD042EA
MTASFSGSDSPVSASTRSVESYQASRFGRWLLAFGLGHAALLLATDVLAAYGVISLVIGAFLLRRSDRALITWSAIGAALLTLLLISGIAFASAPADPAAMGPTPATASGAGDENYLIAGISRITTWLVLTCLTTFGLTAPVAMLLGIWAARRRILEEPHRHLPLLRRTAIIGITICWLGSLPAALVQIGAVPEVNEAALWALQWPTGLAGGLGYVALFGLLANRISRRAKPSRAITAISAVGKRSLSCYLTHSLIMAPVLAAWGLGLGAHLTNATTACFAIGLWLITVAAAYWLDRRGRRGPAEHLLRRLVYRN